MSAASNSGTARALQDDWVLRVLGVQPGGLGPTAGWAAAKLAWRDASETVDGQIGKLTDLLRGDEDPELREIGALGLNALTAGFKVKLMAAMADFDRAPGEAKAAQALRQATAAFRDHLETDERIAACDECPDLAMTIRATLGEGLGALDAATQ